LRVEKLEIFCREILGNSGQGLLWLRYGQLALLLLEGVVVVVSDSDNWWDQGAQLTALVTVLIDLVPGCGCICLVVFWLGRLLSVILLKHVPTSKTRLRQFILWGFLV
jgi:hypothetical protein